ncbi:MAG: TlpA family protein disulfide reductase [Spirosomataceae bacterium]
MKFILFILIVLQTSYVFAQFENHTLKIYPNFPKPQTNLNLEFQPIEKELWGDTIDAIIYENRLTKYPKANEIKLYNLDGKWGGNFQLSKDALSFSIIIGNSTNLDNNYGEGYNFLLFDDNNEILTGSKSAIAKNFCAGWSELLQLKSDKALAKNLFDADFRADSLLKKHFFRYYIKTFQDNQQAISEIENFTKLFDVQEEDYLEIINIYNKFDSKKASEYQDILFKKFPNGRLPLQYSTFEFQKAINNPSNLKQLKKAYESLKLKYLPTQNEDFYKFYLSALKMIFIKYLLTDYLVHNDEKQLENEIKNLNLDYRSATLAYNIWANNLINTDHKSKAEEFAKEAVRNAKLYFDSPRSESFREDDYLVMNQIIEGRKKLCAEAFDTYGVILSLNNPNSNQIVDIFREAAVKFGNRNEVEINQHFIEQLIKKGLIDEAERELSLMISLGKVNTEIEKMASKFFPNSNFEIANNSLNDKTLVLAKNFILTNLENEVINSKDLKGKVIILDFWATWCAPCLASFPEIEKVVKYYQSDENIVFLFINTSDKKSSSELKDFMKKKKYNFNVLIDEKNIVAKEFEVNSLPTKIIIDKSGNIVSKETGVTPNSSEKLIQFIESLK